MTDHNEQTLMEAVIKSVAATPDPRLRQIMTYRMHYDFVLQPAQA